MDKYTIIYFGNEWFAENKTSSHHIANRLSDKFKIIYIECPGLRSPRASGRDFKRIFTKLFNIFSKPRLSEKGFLIYTMLQLPFHRWKIVAWLNQYISYWSVESICRKNKIDNPVLWFLVPHIGTVAKKYRGKAIIYYCTDDYASFPGVEYSVVKQMDDYLTRKADLLFLTSNALYQSKKEFSKNAVYSPHGVDFNHFNKADTYKNKPPQDIVNIKDPIIGFFGLIEHWIDIELIKYLAEYNLSWNIVLIGQCSSDVKDLSQLNNVFFLGQKEYRLLPMYAASFDVAMLPYKSSYQIQFCNPLKLKEYLATGKPVVSVDFPEVRKYSDLVCIANNFEEFALCVSNALNLDNDQKKEKRINSVRKATWDYTAENVINNLNYIID